MYKRVLIKLSGEALKQDKTDNIFDTDYIKEVAKMIKSLTDHKIEVAVVIGAGNIYRGKIAEETGIDRVPADYMGMFGTVINALMMASLLDKMGVKSKVFSALNGVEDIVLKYEENAAKTALNDGNIVFLAGGTGKPFFTTDTASTMRAIELNCDAILMGKNGVLGVYDSDPRINKDAKLFKDITYNEILKLGLTVMDDSAVELIKNTDIEIRVFSMNDLGNFLRAASGEDIGTRCHKEEKQYGRICR